MIEKLVGEPLSMDASLEISVNQGNEADNKQAETLSLPPWFNIYDGLSDQAADEISSGIVREPTQRHFGIDHE